MINKGIVPISKEVHVFLRHPVLVNLLGGLSLTWKSVVRLTDRPDMTLDVYRGRKNNPTTSTIVQANS